MLGRLKDGYQRDDVTMKIKKTSDISDHVHSVILLFPYQSLEDQNAVDDFRKLYCQIGAKFQMQPIVLFTQIDRAKKYFPLDVRNILDSGAINKAMKDF